MAMETELGVMLPQAEEAKKCHSHQTLVEAKGNSSQRPPRPPADSSILDF